MEPMEFCVLAGLILVVIVTPCMMVMFIKDLFSHKNRTGSGSGGGGIIGAMLEMDRIVNPAGQHVQEAKEVEQEEEGIGGE